MWIKGKISSDRLRGETGTWRVQAKMEEWVGIQRWKRMHAKIQGWKVSKFHNAGYLHDICYINIYICYKGIGERCSKQCYILEKERLIIQLVHYVLYAYLNIYIWVSLLCMSIKGHMNKKTKKLCTYVKYQIHLSIFRN